MKVHSILVFIVFICMFCLYGYGQQDCGGKAKKFDIYVIDSFGSTYDSTYYGQVEFDANFDGFCSYPNFDLNNSSLYTNYLCLNKRSSLKFVFHSGSSSLPKITSGDTNNFIGVKLILNSDTNKFILMNNFGDTTTNSTLFCFVDTAISIGHGSYDYEDFRDFLITDFYSYEGSFFNSLFYPISGIKPILITSVFDFNAIDFEVPNSICKDECISLGWLNFKTFDSMYNRATVTDIDWGDGSPKEHWIKTHTGGNSYKSDISYTEHCYSAIGSYTIKATIKNSCGERVIEKVINVTDCQGEEIPIGVNCTLCCDYISKNSISIVSNIFGIYTLTSSMGQVTSCGEGYFEVTLADGSKRFINNTTNSCGPFPFKVKSICYFSKWCPQCNVPCLSEE